MANVTDADRQRLINFLEFVYGLLQAVYLEGYYESVSIIQNQRERQELFSPAWIEFREQFSLESLADAVRKADNARLTNAGLYGNQLTLKLANVERGRLSFVQRKTLSAFRWLLGPIDTLLGSIASAIGVGEALVELKEVLEDLLERDRE